MIIDDVLSSTEPVVLVLSHGESLATDVSKALDAATGEGLQVVRINVDDQPQYGEEFGVGKHPVIVVWYCGEIISRRSRPWIHDVNEMLQGAKEIMTAPVRSADDEESEENDALVDDAPIHVTDADFADLVLGSDLPVLVDFWAEWCGPCRMVAPILDKLAKEFAGQIRIAKVDVDSNPILSQQFRIQSIPSLMFVKEGKIVGMSAGAAPEPALRDAIKQLLDLDMSRVSQQ